jgi:threonine dehydrogenase-like Zn-dependent dehydrogenase
MCPFCRRGEAFLCTDRQVYGINISSAEPPHLSGNYATHILLRNGTAIYPLKLEDNPLAVVPATCSGTTAAHAHEIAGIIQGDNVVIFGAGPVAIFQAAFAKREGANVIVITNNPGPKADMIAKFGADEVLIRARTTPEERNEYVMSQTKEIGVDIVIDTTPDPSIFRESVAILRRGGSYVNPGAAVPAETIPLEMYGDVVSKSLTIKGVWASDASHLEASLELALSSGFPFGELITHRFRLEDHENAWEALKNKEGVKIAFVP